MTAPYRNVQHAIAAAYGSETAAVWGRARWDNSDGGANAPAVRRPASAYQCQFEAIGEAHITMRLIRETMPPHLIVLLDAMYSDASDAVLMTRKVRAAYVLAHYIAESGAYGPPPSAYVLEVVCDWCGLQSLNDDEAAERHGVSARTLRRWRQGRPQYGHGIMAFLNAWLTDAHDVLREVMQARGVVRDVYPECYNQDISPADAHAPLRAFSFLPRTTDARPTRGTARTIHRGRTVGEARERRTG